MLYITEGSGEEDDDGRTVVEVVVDVRLRDGRLVVVDARGRDVVLVELPGGRGAPVVLVDGGGLSEELWARARDANARRTRKNS